MIKVGNYFTRSVEHLDVAISSAQDVMMRYDVTNIRHNVFFFFFQNKKFNSSFPVTIYNVSSAYGDIRKQGARSFVTNATL